MPDPAYSSLRIQEHADLLRRVVGWHNTKEWWHEKCAILVVRPAHLLHMVLDAPETPRMILKAYVCGPGCVTRIEDEGSSLFSQVYQRRPAGCQYAVVEIAPTTIWVIDLYSTQLLADSVGVKPGNYTVFSDLDAAIMARLLAY